MNMNFKKKLSIVIPVYNSEKSLITLVQKIRFELIKKNNYDVEIILINDGSSNKRTSLYLKKIKSNKTKIINLSKNMGQHYATLKGISLAKNDIIVTLDDDLQHDPKYVDIMVKFLKKKRLDVVFAKFKEKKSPKIKKIFSNINNFFVKKIFQMEKDFYLSSFRVLNRDLASKILKKKYNEPYVGCLILSCNPKVGNVTLNHKKRLEGISEYSFLKQLRLFNTLLFDYSNLPLVITSFLALIFCVVGIFSGFYVILKSHITFTIAPGWASTILIISFFSTIIIFLQFMIGMNNFRSSKKRSFEDTI